MTTERITSPTMIVVRVLSTAISPMFLSVIANKAGLTSKQVSRTLSELRRRKLVNCIKLADPKLMQYYRWSMSEEQHQEYLLHSSSEKMRYGSVDLKIAFLTLVRRNPMYSDNPMLQKILADYQFLNAGAP